MRWVALSIKRVDIGVTLGPIPVAAPNITRQVEPLGIVVSPRVTSAVVFLAKGRRGHRP